MRGKTTTLSDSVYAHLVKLQGGGCASCGGQETNRARGSDDPGDVKRLAADHCHLTGEFRGMLCGNCNRAIGLMADDPVRLRAAADYLERFSA